MTKRLRQKHLTGTSPPQLAEHRTVHARRYTEVLKRIIRDPGGDASSSKVQLQLARRFAARDSARGSDWGGRYAQGAIDHQEYMSLLVIATRICSQLELDRACNAREKRGNDLEAKRPAPIVSPIRKMKPQKRLRPSSKEPLDDTKFSAYQRKSVPELAAMKESYRLAQHTPADITTFSKLAKSELVKARKRVTPHTLQGSDEYGITETHPRMDEGMKDAVLFDFYMGKDREVAARLEQNWRVLTTYQDVTWRQFRARLMPVSGVQGEPCRPMVKVRSGAFRPPLPGR